MKGPISKWNWPCKREYNTLFCVRSDTDPAKHTRNPGLKTNNFTPIENICCPPCVDRIKKHEAEMKRMKITAGHQQVMPYLLVEKADALADFLRRIFHGQEMIRILNADKKIQHSEIKIGDSTLLLAEAPGRSQVIPGSMYVYVKDTDKTYYDALDAGAESLMPPLDEDDNMRSAGFRDPFGNIWWIATLA